MGLGVLLTPNWLKRRIDRLLGNDEPVFVNFYDKYTLDDPLLEHARNLLNNGITLTRKQALSKKYDMTKLFDRGIENRMGKGHSNGIIIFRGSPGLGKSMGAAAVALKYAKAYIKYNNLSVDPFTYIGYYFNINEMNEFLAGAPCPGRVHWLDEQVHMTGKRTRVKKWATDNIMTTIRDGQESFIFCDPKECPVAFYNYRLEPEGKCYDEQGTRFLIYDEEDRLLGHIILDLDEIFANEAWLAEYLKRKRANIKDVKQAAGQVTATIEKTKFYADAEKLAELARQEGILHKGDLDAIAIRLDLNADTEYMKLLKSEVWLKVDPKRSRSRKVATDDGDKEVKQVPPAPPGTSYQEYVGHVMQAQDRPRPETFVLANFAGGMVYRDILQESKRDGLSITHNFIAKTTKDNRNTDLAFWAEWWVAEIFLGVPANQLKEVCAGTRHKPDIEWRGKIVQVKLRFTTDPSEKFRQLGDGKDADCIQEATRCLELKTETGAKHVYEFWYINPWWDDHIRILEMDPDGQDSFHADKSDPGYTVAELLEKYRNFREGNPPASSQEIRSEPTAVLDPRGEVERHLEVDPNLAGKIAKAFASIAAEDKIFGIEYLVHPERFLRPENLQKVRTLINWTGSDLGLKWAVAAAAKCVKQSI